jgi:2-isopropylmalate synthase
VVLSRGGQEFRETASGDGPVDALFAAINRIAGEQPQLVDYAVRAVTGGSDALGEAVVKLRDGNELAIGRASSTDILESSAKAYVHALNKLLERRRAWMVAAASRTQEG